MRILCMLLVLVITLQVGATTITIPHGNNYFISQDVLDTEVEDASCTYGVDDVITEGGETSLSTFGFSSAGCMDGVTINTSGNSFSVLRLVRNSTDGSPPSTQDPWQILNVIVEGDATTPICEDPEAENTGGPLPCTYTTPPPPVEPVEPNACSNLGYFMFTHSLGVWDAQNEPGSTAESSIGYWLNEFATHAGKTSAIVGSAPVLASSEVPNVSLGFSNNDYDPAPTSEYDPNLIDANIVMPWNFIQGNASSPETTEQAMLDMAGVFEFIRDTDPDVPTYLYLHWPEIISVNSGFSHPLSSSEWEEYKEHTNTYYLTWFLSLQQVIKEVYPTINLKMIPVGPIINDILDEVYMGDVAYTDLYVDEAPHGTRTTYFLSAMIHYRVMVGQNIPQGYSDSSGGVLPQVLDNIDAISTLIEVRLAEYYSNGVAF